MPDFIGIDVIGLPALQRALRDLPDQMQDAVIPEMAKVIKNRMTQYAPYQYVSRAQAYPNAPYKPGYFSRAQFRYVMAAISRGEIRPGQPNRTQALAMGWKVIGDDRFAFVANEENHAQYVQGAKGQQANHPYLVGWKGTDVVAPEEDRNLLAAAIRMVNRVARKLGFRVSG